MLVDRAYEWLKTLPSPDAERILGAGLRGGEPAWSERMLRPLLERATPAAWAELIADYARLPQDVRLEVHKNRESFDEGLPLAAQSAEANVRYNALLALETQPRSRLLYVASNALLDSVVRIRAVAGRVLRKSAENAVRVLANPPEGAKPEQLQQLRREITLAMEESVRTYELHLRVDVLQAALWFGRDFERLLWNRLAQPRSRAAAAVWEYLNDWSEAPLAWFLLTALGQTRWRAAAAKALRAWSSVPETCAVLRESALLERPEFTEHLGAVHSPGWFRELDRDLTELPADLRPLAPRWLMQVSFTEDERLTYLSRWCRSVDLDLQLAAVEALCRMRSPEVPRILRSIENPPPDVAERIEARLQADAAGPKRKSSRAAAPQAGQPPTESSEGARSATEAGAAEEIATLLREAGELIYRELRTAALAAPAEQRVEIMEVLRSRAGAWRGQIRADLQHDDANLRLFALQLISVPELAPHMSDALRPLTDDPAPGLRRLAQSLCAAVEQLGPGAAAGGEPGAQVLSGGDVEALALLDEELTQLVAGQADALPRVAELLDQVYHAEPAEATA